MSAGSKRVRRHNRERGPYLFTAGPSDGPGVRRFWPPAIDSRRRGKSLSQGALFSIWKWSRGGEPNVLANVIQLYSGIKKTGTLSPVTVS